MYDQSDPRAALAPTPVARAPAQPVSFAAAEYGRFYAEPPQEADEAGGSWYFRGQNFVLHYMEAKPGARLDRIGQPDEYAVLLPDAVGAVAIESAGQTEHVAGRHLAFVPPGDSSVRVTEGGRIIRLLTTQSKDLVAKCSNCDAYREQHPNIPRFAAWPAPRDGYRIRTYPIDVPATPGRFGSIYRCSTLMINMLDIFTGPRDATKMSPHFHDDFEQCSLALEGSFIHYIRWPWTTNLNVWRDDDKEVCEAPSVAIIPPPAIHTSRAIGPGDNRLVDIFCPPRLDFSEKPGWVLNADDYPMPGQA